MAQFPNEINPLVVPFPAVDTLSPLVVLFPTAAPVNPTLVSPLEVGLMTSADVVVLVNAKLLLLPLLLGVTIHSLEELGVTGRKYVSWRMNVLVGDGNSYM